MILIKNRKGVDEMNVRSYFTVFILALAQWVFSEEWVLDPALFETRFGSEISGCEFQEVLREEGVEIQFAQPMDLVLWKGKRTAIFLAVAPLVPYHLWVGISGQHSLDGCSSDDFEELAEAVWKARKALKETLGADAFLIFATDAPRTGKGCAGAGVEILPCISEGRAMDACEKTLLNDYMLFNRFCLREAIESEEAVAALRRALPELTPAVEPETPQGDWVQKIIRHQEALRQSLATIHAELAASGALRSGKLPLPLEEDGSVLENRINSFRCAFCEPKVIERQTVAEWKGVYVLMNHKPFSPFGNFLILPKRHQCGFDLAKEEAVPFWEAAVKIKRMLQEACPSGEVILYVQDGPAMGQTVPHTHMHVYVIPSPLKLHLTGIQHIRNRRPVIDEAEMRKACESHKNLFPD